MTFRALAVAACLGAVLAGCAPGPQGFLREGLDQGREMRVAVLPFANATDAPCAGWMVTAAFVAALMGREGYAVEQYGNVKMFLVARRVLPRRGLDLATLAGMRRRLGVDAVVLGRVEAFGPKGPVGWDAVPEVAVSLRMVDARTGEVLLMAEHRRHGDDTVPLLDIGRVRTEGELARLLAEDVVAMLP